MGSIPCRRTWQLTPLFLPGKSHGLRSLAGHSPWGCKESDTTEQLNNNIATIFLTQPKQAALPRGAPGRAIRLSLQKTLAEAKRSACSISSARPARLQACPSHLQAALPTPVQGACLHRTGTTILLFLLSVPTVIFTYLHQHIYITHQNSPGICYPLSPLSITLAGPRTLSLL